MSQVNNKGPWTEQEDKKLINLVEKYGAGKWSFISSHFPERIGKQCRERWFNHLCPTVNKTAWSKEEEWILFILHNKMGNKWSQLCKYLPGRTDNTIKNHWNSTMKKRIEKLQNEYNNIIKDKTEEEINKIQHDILQKCKSVAEKENQIFYNEKMKNYEKFKNATVENKQNMYKLKKILLFRTHSKKIKRRGRKKKYINPEDKTTSPNKNYISKSIGNRQPKRISQFKLSNLKDKNKVKSKKKYDTPKNKKYKKKKKIGEPFIDENKEYPKKISLISSPIHKFIISRNDLDESLKKNENNNKIINNNINISNNINIINNINDKNPLLINNYNNGNIDTNALSFNNNYILYQNPINIYNSILDSQNRKEKIEIGEKNKQNNFNLRDINLSTPLKMNEINSKYNLNETNKIFIKTEKVFNNENNNIFENSAFNKNELLFPSSNVKGHLYFTSSIKKPIKIVSEESENNNKNVMKGVNNNNQNEPNFLNNNNNIINSGNTINKNMFKNMNNLTPNEFINFSENNGINTLAKFNYLVYSSSKKPEFFNNSELNRNNLYQVFSPSKDNTPFATSNANLDKMFFSNLNAKN